MLGKIILASASPRRKELMMLLGAEFQVVVSDCEERITKDIPEDVTMELSRQKAEAVAEHVGRSNIVIGADTIVSLEGRILGKPSGKEEAYEMISSLQGKVHQVYTGVTILSKEKKIENTFFVKTDVTVTSMTEEEICEYINTKEPYDKAGAYGIQGLFGKYVESIAGDYNNVVGLPVHRLYKELKGLEII